MTVSLSPQEIQELAAGYVLGDLDSDEAELFQTLLAEWPELQQDVTALREALALMPYELTDVVVADRVRSQLLTQAEAELCRELAAAPISLDASQPAKLEPTQPKWSLWQPWCVSGVAAGLAIVCGLAALRLSGQIRFLQAQSDRPTDRASVVHTWSGLDDILQDHQKSLHHPDGPVDFAVGKPSDILDRLTGFQTTVAALPLLSRGKLLGGSNCQFGQTQGLRLTYQLSPDQTVSAYQLDISNKPDPELPSAQVTLQQPDGTGLVLWRDDDYLYALVATLPIPELQTLAHAISGI
jgi:anti-sigma factor RsiW